MSYGGANYQQYGGNPYGGAEEGAGAGAGGYGSSNPYGTSAAESNPYGTSATGYGASNPYGAPNPYGGQGVYDPTARPAPSHMASGVSAASDYSRPTGSYAPPVPAMPMQELPAQDVPMTAASGAMSNQDFLTRVEGVKSEIRQLTANIAEIGTIHQRALSSPDTSASAQLENIVAQTQILNTRIKDQIKLLETDAAKSNKNQTKDSQIRTLKSNFKSQLEDYQREEQNYRQRYRDQIARQYRIVNPEATDVEVREAADADWGNEGVFQTALKSNRTGAAQSVLGSVRARHNDIQQIERTLIELNQLFQDLAEAVVLQEAPIQQTEVQTTNVLQDTEQGNVQLDKGIKSAGRARKMRKWCFIIIVLIICILALVLGLYFGIKARNDRNNRNQTTA